MARRSLSRTGQELPALADVLECRTTKQHRWYRHQSWVEQTKKSQVRALIILDVCDRCGSERRTWRNPLNNGQVYGHEYVHPENWDETQEAYGASPEEQRQAWIELVIEEAREAENVSAATRLSGKKKPPRINPAAVDTDPELEDNEDLQPDESERHLRSVS